MVSLVVQNATYLTGRQDIQTLGWLTQIEGKQAL